MLNFMLLTVPFSCILNLLMNFDKISMSIVIVLVQVALHTVKITFCYLHDLYVDFTDIDVILMWIL